MSEIRAQQQKSMKLNSMMKTRQTKLQQHAAKKSADAKRAAAAEKAITDASKTAATSILTAKSKKTTATDFDISISSGKMRQSVNCTDVALTKKCVQKSQLVEFGGTIINSMVHLKKINDQYQKDNERNDANLEDLNQRIARKNKEIEEFMQSMK